MPATPDPGHPHLLDVCLGALVDAVLAVALAVTLVVIFGLASARDPDLHRPAPLYLATCSVQP